MNGAEISSVLCLGDWGDRACVLLDPSHVSTLSSVRQRETQLQTICINEKKVFPGRSGRGQLCPESADAILRAAFKRLEIKGASTHSSQGTAITANMQLMPVNITCRILQV